MIAKEADSNTGSLGWAFKLKEEILCELVGYVFDKQFDTAEELLKGVTDDKVLFYAVEATLQLYMAEQNEQVREMYNVSYSFTDSAKIIYNKMSEKLQEIFKEYLPHLKAKDFYEREIASDCFLYLFLRYVIHKKRRFEKSLYFSFHFKISVTRNGYKVSHNSRCLLYTSMSPQIQVRLCVLSSTFSHSP